MLVMTSVNVGSTFATEEGETISTEVGEAISTLALSGTVTSLDKENSIIVVESLKQDESQEAQSVTLSVDENTSIIKDFQEAALGDLVEGDLVSIEYKVDSNGQNVAVSIISNKE